MRDKVISLRPVLSTSDVGDKRSAIDTSGRKVSLQLIQPVADAIKAFPSTRYYGSKRRLLPWIYANLGNLAFETVLDPFGGTGSISLLFKAMHKSVTYHDAFRFNEDVGRTLLADEIAMTRADVEQFIDSTEPRCGIVTRNFTGVFYTDAENAWIDGFAAAVNETSKDVGSIALLRYLLYQACLKKRPFNLFHRANLGLRSNSDIKRTFGNAVTWERTFRHHMLQAYDELATCTSGRQGNVQILPCGNADDIATGYDLVYIDPPYISLQERYNSDDYWRRYHFLEGLARYHEWESLIDKTSPIGLFDSPAWMTAWSRKQTFEERLFLLIEKHRQSIVVLSYVTEAHPDEATIKALFKKHFTKVSVHTAEHSHALSRSRKRELLFIGRPR